jgi:hypothetical protein
MEKPFIKLLLLLLGNSIIGIKCNMKPYIILFIFSVLLSSCEQNKIATTIQKNGNLTLVDSTKECNNFLPYSAENRQGFYPVFYIGKQTDTIKLGQEAIFEWNYQQKSYPYYKNFADSTEIKIIVDTTFSLNYTEYYKHYSEKEGKKIIDSTKTFKAYPIFVYTLGYLLIYVGKYNHFGHTVRQAKNEQGIWVDIETPISYFCDTNARDVVIEEKQVLIAKLLRYKGDFKTLCRLKFTTKNSFLNIEYNVYSNTFIDYIDKKQLIDSLEN